MSVARSLLGGALALLFTGCGGTGDDPSATCQAPTCVPVADHYAAEITSPTGDNLVATEFDELTFDTTSGYFLVLLPTAARVSGVVQADGVPVPCTVVFSRPSRIPGRPDVFYQASVDTKTGAYQVSVPPSGVNEVYTVRVRPTDSGTFPPAVQQVQVSGDQTLDLTVASGARLFSLKGQITDVVNAPIADTRVVLRDAVTQLDLSTVAVTDGKGRFEILISQDLGFSGSVVLVAERGDPATGLLTLTLPLTAQALQAELLKAAMQLLFPALPAPTQRTISITGTSSSGADKPVAGAHVQLITSLSGSLLSGGVQLVHEIDTQTNGDGKLDAALYPDSEGTRKYTVSVSPPADSEFQASTTEVSVGPAQGVGEALRLAVRSTVIGRVLDPSFSPLKGVVVQPAFDTIAATANTSLATSTHTSGVTSDVDGRFALRLDNGSYDLAIVPPASSQLPRRWLLGRAVRGNVDLGDVTLPRPVSFDGMVLDAASNPVKATVHLYVVPAGNARCVESGGDCLQPPRLQAEGTTDEHGRAPLLLPSEGTITP